MSIEAESRREWEIKGSKPDVDEIKMGCLQRIAMATEAMAQQWTELKRERDIYKRKYEGELETVLRLHRRIRGLKGALTRRRKEQKP